MARRDGTGTRPVSSVLFRGGRGCRRDGAHTLRYEPEGILHGLALAVLTLELPLDCRGCSRGGSAELGGRAGLPQGDV